MNDSIKFSALNTKDTNNLKQIRHKHEYNSYSGAMHLSTSWVVEFQRLFVVSFVLLVKTVNAHLVFKNVQRDRYKSRSLVNKETKAKAKAKLNAVIRFLHFNVRQIFCTLTQWAVCASVVILSPLNVSDSHVSNYKVTKR